MDEQEHPHLTLLRQQVEIQQRAIEALAEQFVAFSRWREEDLERSARKDAEFDDRIKEGRKRRAVDLARAEAQHALHLRSVEAGEGQSVALDRIAQALERIAAEAEADR